MQGPKSVEVPGRSCHRRSNARISPDYHWHLWARIWQTPVLGEWRILTMNRFLLHVTLEMGSKKLTKQHMRDAYRFVDSDTRQ